MASLGRGCRRSLSFWFFAVCQAAASANTAFAAAALNLTEYSSNLRRLLPIALTCPGPQRHSTRRMVAGQETCKFPLHAHTPHRGSTQHS